MSKKILVSGVQATGKLHFGNYFGAMKQNIELGNSDEYESYIFVADYHALTTVKDGNALRNSTKEIVAAYIACGLDVSKVNMFKQSDVVEHAELSTILSNVVTMPYLMRAHAYKDHEAKDKEVNIGLFTYPVLMAADILIYNADIVPVGADQKQHIEYARDIAGFYNRAWNVEQFKLPTELIVESVGTIPGTDGEKMSKSKGNVIPLFGTDEEVKKIIMGIVTDSAAPGDRKDPDQNNIYNIHKHFLNKDEDWSIRNKFINSTPENPYGYAEAKTDLLLSVMKWREGKYEKYLELLEDDNAILDILSAGSIKANIKAKETIEEVRKTTGLSL